jgi:hypothetical protein
MKCGMDRHFLIKAKHAPMFMRQAGALKLLGLAPIQDAR